MSKDVSRRDVLLGALVVASPLGAACLPEDESAVAEAGAPSPTASPIDSGTATPLPSQGDAAPAVDAGEASASSDASDAHREPLVGGPGVVIEVTHCGSVVNDVVQAGPVREMMSRGMLELTGRATEQEAWRALFSAGDVVGIKVSPVGYPKVFSQIATVSEIIRGLNLAGVANDHIVVFDRYRDNLDAIGYAASLPVGVRFAAASPAYANDQTDTTGYDTSELVDLPRVYPGDDASDPVKRRSYLCNIVSKEVTKVINVPALKDHASGGITFALKGMTYGCVNNVSRTHVPPDNWTRDFIPAIAAMTKLRQKVVLHVADALVACFDGGPAENARFQTFNYASLLFATDPVALDRIGWKILDDRRALSGLPALAGTGIALTNPDGAESFDERQPQHVLTAGAAGLGVSDLALIQHRRVELGTAAACGAAM